MVFDATTLPTASEVDDIIDEVENIIDKHTERSWKENTVTNEHHDYDGAYHDRNGRLIYAIHLKNPNLRTLDSLQGDKLEVWQGAWKDLLVEGTQGAAMYEGDFWVDYENDIIYLFSEFPDYGMNMIRVTYRYGETSVPNGIRQAATLLAAAIINERYEMYKEVSKDTSPAMNLAKSYEERAYKILEKYAYGDLDLI